MTPTTVNHRHGPTIAPEANGPVSRLFRDGQHPVADEPQLQTENGQEIPSYQTDIGQGETPSSPSKPPLALFCYEPPDSYIGGYVTGLATALAQRHTPVHLFTRHPFACTAPEIHVHAVGVSSAEALFQQVETYTQHACNAFLQEFPAGSEVTLFGQEWSAAPALSLLHGVRHCRTIFSLHTLERQRGDLNQELSRQIAEAERSGLRQAHKVLVQEEPTVAVARSWVPECGERLVQARPLFPIHRFETQVDPGAVKARYEVGPVDPTILFIGDLHDRYGPDLLLKAMPALLRNNQQIRLIMAGCGENFWPLRVYTRYLLLEHAIRLVGNVEGQAAEELIQAADVVVIPSRESTPWWPIQAAWAARRPVVATHPAAPELLEHEVASVLCYPNENSLVWGVERVLCDPEHGRALAAAGRQKLEKHFGWNTRAEQVEELMSVLVEC